MTDPMRLLDCADDFERALLGSAKRDAGSERALGRALAAVSGALVTLGAAGTASATTGVLTVAKWLAAGALLGAVTTSAATYVGGRLSQAPAPRSVSAAPPPPVAAVAARRAAGAQPATAASDVASVPVDPVAPAASTSTSTPRAEAASAAPSATADNSGTAPSAHADLARELALLESARQSLNHGDARAALSALQQHGQEFPLATLEPEATLLQIQALGELGNVGAARRLAEAFLLAHPSGPYAARAHGLLDGLPKK